VHVEVPVERTVFREVPVPIYGEEKVIVKEVTVPVEVVKEVAVPVEHVVTKEVHVPVEIGMRSETRVGESRVVIGEETRASAMTSDHYRSAVPFNGPTSIGNVTGTVTGASGIGTNLSGVYGSSTGFTSGYGSSTGFTSGTGFTNGVNGSSSPGRPYMSPSSGPMSSGFTH
jgi:hypothetical protein